MSAVTEMTPHLLEKAGVVSDGDQYADSTASLAVVATLPSFERELAVTAFIERAGSELKRAIASGESADVLSGYKDQAAAIADLTKRLNLSKDAVLDSQILQRRAENGLGVAIREGQARGEIRGAGGDRKSDDIKLRHPQFDIASPYDFAKHTELYGDGKEGGNGIYALSEIKGEAFEQVLDEAREEGNVSRANVARKVKARVASDAEDAGSKRANNKADYLHSLATLHPTARIAFDLDGKTQYASLSSFDGAARRAGVAWKLTERQWQARVETSRDVLDRSSLGISIALDAINVRVDMQTITPEQATEVLERLDSSALNRIIKQLKEITNV